MGKVIKSNDPPIEMRAEYVCQLYPREKPIGDGAFGIGKWQDVETGLLHVATGFYKFEPLVGEEYKLTLRKVEHEKYGKQFELIEMRSSMEVIDDETCKKFLSQLLTKKQFKALYERFEHPLKILEEGNVEKLCEVHGIGPRAANRIVALYDQQRDYAPLYAALAPYHLTQSTFMKIVRTYGFSVRKCQEVLQNDPYALAREVRGIGFKMADEIAIRNGMDPRSSKRLAGYLYFQLEESGQSGRSYEYKDAMLQQILREFGQDIIVSNGGTNNLADALCYLKEKDIVGTDVDPVNGKERVFLQKYRLLEERVALELHRLIDAAPRIPVPEKWQRQVKAYEFHNNIEFTPEQRAGIEEALKANVCLITGYAGTGKSTLVGGLLQAIGPCHIVQTALAGKAAARLQEITGRSGMTIHRLLGRSDEPEDLDFDVIILDELSLVGGEIFYKLLRAIKSGSKLVMLGDPGQLEAIGSMNVIHDLANSKRIPKAELTTIHRQAQNSGIITMSVDVRQHTNTVGRKFTGRQTLGVKRDMHVAYVNDRADLMQMFQDEYYTWLQHPLVDGDPFKLHALSPMKQRGDTSVAQLNNIAQQIVNTDGLVSDDKYFVQTTKDGQGWWLCINDKLMCVKNDYHVPVIDKRGHEASETAIFNGWTGRVEGIDDEHIYVRFEMAPELLCKISKEFLDMRFMLGYASTIHKFQGSSAPIVIGVIDYCTPPMMRTSELVYTLLTRAESHCVLLAENRAVDDAIAASAVSSKQTFLVQKLEDAFTGKIKMPPRKQTEVRTNWGVTLTPEEKAGVVA